MPENGDSGINRIVVMPAGTGEAVADADTALRDLAAYVRDKTAECEEKVKNASAVTFMANHLQNRQLCTEISVQMGKLYGALGVSTRDEYERKMTELAAKGQDTKDLVDNVKDSLQKWEKFLESVDRAVDEVAGPNSAKSVDNVKLGGKGRSGQSTLLSYLRSSPYSMMFIEVVFSFSSSRCGDHVLKMYEKLGEFQALDCDILLLTKSTGSEGGGFLKLVGVPFRLLLDEQQSLARILQHRQSAVAISGEKAIHLLAEISINDKLALGTEEEDRFGKQGGVLLLNNDGEVLYHASCNQESDWPDVGELLKSVKQNKSTKSASPRADSKQSEKANAKPEKDASTQDTNVTVAKKKCCIIM